VAIEGDGASLAYTSHNPSGDDGPGCPKLADMKAKIGGAKILHELSGSSETSDDNVTLGDQIELLMFEKDGKVGFYAVKVFDHGDDATSYCAAPGSPAGAKNLTTLYDKEKAELLAATFMSLHFKF
jgi:hypothetical protein